MHPQIVRQIFIFCFRRLPHFGAHDARLGKQLVVVAHRFLLACLFTNPNRQRCAPKPFAA